jgi:soluble lytic murein transglycosylase-like protein
MGMGALALLAVLLLAPGAWADIYTYVAEDGSVVFTDSPVEGARRLQGSPGEAPTLQELIELKARQHGVEPELVRAVVQVESGFRLRARSPKGAMGLMQLMPRTAYSLGVYDPYDPEENLDAGVRYLKSLLERFGDLRLALAAYNAGPRRVSLYGSVPPYRETRRYVQKVLSLYQGQKARRSVIYRVVLSDGTVLYTNIPPRRRE